MTSKIVFLNLLVDSLWSDESFLEKVFDVKSPGIQKLARVNEYLGRYFANDGDYVICAEKASTQIDDLSKAYLKLNSVNWIIAPSELSKVENFVIEVSNQLGHLPSMELLVAGVSRLELSMKSKLGTLNKYQLSDLNLLKKLNSKDYLLELGNQLKIKIPKSSVVTGSQISSSKHLYKSLVSSGGSGVYGFEDLERIKLWSQRRKLEVEWNSSKWLMQESLDRKMDINCFGWTFSKEMKMVQVKYDKTRLSYQHDFDFPLDSMIKDQLESAFIKVRDHLIENGYEGPFGFDSIVAKSGDVFPVVDLNVRMNKSHVLDQVLKSFRIKLKHCSFYRLRFINSKWPNFLDFWNYFENEIKLHKIGSTKIFPIDASFWNQGKSECLIAATSDYKESMDSIEEWISNFLLENKGQGRD